MARLLPWQSDPRLPRTAFSWSRYVVIAWLSGATLSAAPRSESGLQSLGAQLVTAVKNGEVGKTSALLRRWKTTGKLWPLGPDNQPLLFLAIEGREKTHAEIIELLLANGASVDARGPSGMTALHWAAAKGYAERTAQILQHHPQLETTDDRGRTPLLVAHSEAAEKLLAAGANAFAMDKDGMNALHYAAQTGASHLEIIWQAGFKVADARSNAGLTPLHIAAVEGTESSVGWLLDHGAKVNAVSAADYSYLPRHLAPGYGYEIRIPRGATALRLASLEHEKTKWSSGRYRSVVELLKARGGAGASLALAGIGIVAIASAIGTLAFAIIFFTGILLLDARLTGWHRLAQAFPATAEPPGTNRHQNGGVGSIGLVYLKGLMHAAADERGLYLAFPGFLRAGHMPLHVPWSQLRITSEKNLFGLHIVQLQVGDPKIGSIYLRGGVSAAVVDRLRC